MARRTRMCGPATRLKVQCGIFPLGMALFAVAACNLADEGLRAGPARRDPAASSTQSPAASNAQSPDAGIATGATPQGASATQEQDAAANAPLGPPWPSIPSNFDTAPWIAGTSGIDVPPSAAPDDQGAFRFICKPSHNLYDDPIVAPGKPGASHLHTFTGNTLANANSTYDSLRTTGEGTCDGGPLNRSAYWMPAMMNGQGQVVMPDYYVVYYKAVPGIRHFPRGLKMLIAYPYTSKSTLYHGIVSSWGCEAEGSGSGSTIDAVTNCPAGSHLIARMSAPTCWNGVDLDSPDHLSHMAYRYYDGTSGSPVCPPGYPIDLPSYSLIAAFSHQGPSDIANWYLSSDRMPGKAPLAGGTTLHADWFGAWDDGVVDAFSANCLDKVLNCSGGQLGDGRFLVRPSGFSWTTVPNLVAPPPSP